MRARRWAAWLTIIERVTMHLFRSLPGGVYRVVNELVDRAKYGPVPTLSDIIDCEDCDGTGLVCACGVKGCLCKPTALKVVCSGCEGAGLVEDEAPLPPTPGSATPPPPSPRH